MLQAHAPEPPSLASKSSDKDHRTPVLLWWRNHFDLVWRRGWKAGYWHQDRFYQSYSWLQRRLVEEYVQSAQKDGTSFEIEQALSLRNYLEFRPGHLPVLRQLARERRFDLLGCGEAVIDTNQCHGETLVRNLASGTRYGRKILGIEQPIGGRYDGFGHSAQLPQVFRQCGYRWVTSLAYAKPDADYWKGIDGSIVFTRETDFGGRDHFYDHCYYEPCPVCSGTGGTAGGDCPACSGAGFDRSADMFPDTPPLSPEEVDGPFALYRVRSEEMFIDAALPEKLRRWNAGQDKFAYRWGLLRDAWPYFENDIAAVDHPPAHRLCASAELNPTQTGTLVTRMRLKQAIRRAESTFYSVERFLALQSDGLDPLRRKTLESLWRELPLLFFHDSITGTLADPPANEMIAVADRVTDEARRLCGALPRTHAWEPGQRLALYNPDASGQPVDVECLTSSPLLLRGSQGSTIVAAPAVPLDLVAREPDLIALAANSRLRPPVPTTGTWISPRPLDMETFVAESVAPPVIDDTARRWSSDAFVIEWDERGLKEIRSAGTNAVLTTRGQSSPNDLILEEDIGDPWGTRDLRRARRPLGGETRLAGFRCTDTFAEWVFTGVLRGNRAFGRETDTSVFGLEWTQTLRCQTGSRRLDFVTEIYWKSCNRRIRVIFPTPARSDTGWYGIPAGRIKRDRYEMKENFLWSPNGDWPALDFFSTDPAPGETGVALLNRCTVSSRIEDGALLLSLLRSPGFGSCLERYAQDYPIPHEGIRDPGYHLFHYALAAVEGPDDLPAVAALAAAYNQPVLPLPSGTPAPTAFSFPAPLTVLGCKPAWDGAPGVVLRLLNNHDAPFERTLTAGPVRSWQRLDPMENPLGEPSEDTDLHLNLRPFEIVTLFARTEAHPRHK